MVRLCGKALVLLSAVAVSTAQDAVSSPQPTISLPHLLEFLPMPEADDNGDTLMIRAARAADIMPEESRVLLFEPFIEEMLRMGYDPLVENNVGCNAVFHLAGMPDFYQRLNAANLLPRELAIRIPHDEGALLRYMRLRNNQAKLARTDASRDYLTRRYCAPAFARAERLMRNYMGAHSLVQIPDSAMADILTFMRLADQTKAEDFINSLPIWEHGEHFLEEIPAHLLKNLSQLGWNVDGGQLRKALHKLGTMLPVSKEDMIECDASLPMSDILRMLTAKENTGAMPELEQYAAAFDPGIVHTALALQMQLQGLPLPWEPAFAELNVPELQEIREALAVDAAIRRGDMQTLTGQQLTQAATTLRKHAMPMHAEMLEGIEENGRMSLRPELQPAFRTRYEELREDAPHVALLRYLMQHRELLQSHPTEEAAS